MTDVDELRKRSQKLGVPMNQLLDQDITDFMTWHWGRA